MADQYVFCVDFNKCIACKTCEMACNEYYGLEGIHRRKVVFFQTEILDNVVHFTISCNHCQNPVCVSICPQNNFHKRRDGIVVLQSNNCRTCLRCVTACPFRAPKINPKTNRADKCNMCVERIERGFKPVCVESCVTHALNIMKVDSAKRKSMAMEHKTRIPLESYTNPSIVSTTKKKKRTIFLREG